MAANAETVPNAEDTTLEITRMFDAPLALVWNAWTDEKQALQWSGPRKFPVVEAHHDIRPGGKWRSCLKGTETGELLWQGGVYKEVVPQKKLVFTFGWDDEEDGRPGPETLITITFADKGGKTEMRFRQERLASASSRDGHRMGWNSSFDRLDDLLRA